MNCSEVSKASPLLGIKTGQRHVQNISRQHALLLARSLPQLWPTSMSHLISRYTSWGSMWKDYFLLASWLVLFNGLDPPLESNQAKWTEQHFPCVEQGELSIVNNMFGKCHPFFCLQIATDQFFINVFVIWSCLMNRLWKNIFQSMFWGLFGEHITVYCLLFDIYSGWSPKIHLHCFCFVDYLRERD